MIDPSKWKVGTSYSPDSSFQLKDIKEAGLDGIELVLAGNRSNLHIQGLRENFNCLIEEAQVLDLEVWSVHLPFAIYWDISTVDSKKRNNIIEYHLEWLEWVSELDIKRVVIHPSYEPIPGKQRSERIHACKKSLNELVKRAKLLGIQICVENLPRTCLGNTGEELQDIIGECRELKVCCDVNHLLSETPVDFITEIGSRIETLHISDYDGIDEKHWMPGEGIIDWMAVIHSLVQFGYDGPFIFEVNSEDPEEMIKCWKELLRSYQCMDYENS